jgi:hypothetical protein
MALTKRNLEYLFFVALTALAMLCAWAPSAFAGYTRDDQPRRPAVGSQQVLPEYQSFGSPIVATTNYIKTTYAGPTSAAAVTLTSFTHQPDVPRNLTITPTGTTTDVESCVITVTGTNAFGRTITEDFTFAADASTAQTGNKAFKTVSSIAWPASCESGGFAATWIVGVGSKLGLNRCLDAAGDVGHATLAGVKEATAPTIAADSTHVESNTATLNSALNSTAVKLLYYQNYRCLP